VLRDIICLFSQDNINPITYGKETRNRSEIIIEFSVVIFRNIRLFNKILTALELATEIAGSNHIFLVTQETFDTIGRNLPLSEVLLLMRLPGICIVTNL
jgi:hypothetical protein